MERAFLIERRYNLAKFFRVSGANLLQNIKKQFD